MWAGHVLMLMLIVVGAMGEEQQDSEYWLREAREALREREEAQLVNTRRARNVIMFLGDGMSLTTQTAARALRGGEDNLYFETFPAVGLVKTYCVDAAVPDSACTSTAYLCGVKGNRGTIGVTARVPRGHCTAALNTSNHVTSVGEWTLRAGGAAGYVTTTRVTNASPAGLFARTAERDWEGDADVAAAGCGEGAQSDVARQLLEEWPGAGLAVVLGGGKREFIPREREGGRRLDGRDLAGEWLRKQRAAGRVAEYVQGARELQAAVREGSGTERLLGLFADDHMPYRAEGGEDRPSLADMTEAAVRILTEVTRESDTGYFLFVEGGRVDHAHHNNMAALALDETLELDEAVRRAGELTSERDTLLVVTADHSHVMTYSGYVARGRDVRGPSDDIGDDGAPYMTLSYANGPGFREHASPGVRRDVTQEPEYGTLRFKFPAEVSLVEETHGGEDVVVYARGPQQHMFAGVYEQSQVPHLMGYAACLGDGLHAPVCTQQ